MLSGKLLEQTVEALLDAFPLEQQLNQIVAYADIGVQFGYYPGPRPGAVLQLLQDADAKGYTSQLLQTAFRHAPRNLKLRAVWAKFAPFNADLSIVGTDLPTFEKVLFTARPFEEVGPFIAKLSVSRRAVCRIEPQPAAEGVGGYGTGFLVSPDVVMTNAHVADEFWGEDKQCKHRARVPAAQVRLRFDAEIASDGGEQPGVVVSLADDFKILYSDRFDLDYALIRLARAIGNEDAGGSRRGTLTPISYPFLPGVADPLLVLQHPEGKPLKLAFGSVETVPPPPRRVRYVLNSNGGSSGSPVFSQALDVVAIHHSVGGAQSNEGIPFDAIKAEWNKPDQKSALTAAGLEHLL